MQTKVFKINRKRPNLEFVRQAALILKKGGIVAFPTETVYGLAANIRSKKAMARLCRIKKRPASKPFTVHIAKKSDLKRLGCVINKAARLLIKRFWPGPLTIIFEGKGRNKIGVRFPDDKVALLFLKKAGCLTAAPSANLSGTKPQYKSKGVIAQFNAIVDAILDAGDTRFKEASTIVDVSAAKPSIIREGAIKKEKLDRAIKYA